MNYDDRSTMTIAAATAAQQQLVSYLEQKEDFPVLIQNQIDALITGFITDLKKSIDVYERCCKPIIDEGVAVPAFIRKKNRQLLKDAVQTPEQEEYAITTTYTYRVGARTRTTPAVYAQAMSEAAIENHCNFDSDKDTEEQVRNFLLLYKEGYRDYPYKLYECKSSKSILFIPTIAQLRIDRYGLPDDEDDLDPNRNFYMNIINGDNNEDNDLENNGDDSENDDDFSRASGNDGNLIRGNNDVENNEEDLENDDISERENQRNNNGDLIRGNMLRYNVIENLLLFAPKRKEAYKRIFDQRCVIVLKRLMKMGLINKSDITQYGNGRLLGIVQADKQFFYKERFQFVTSVNSKQLLVLNSSIGTILHFAASKASSIATFRAVFETGLRVYPRMIGITLLYKQNLAYRSEKSKTPFSIACQVHGREKTMAAIQSSLIAVRGGTDHDRDDQPGVHCYDTVEALLYATVNRFIHLDAVYSMVRTQPDMLQQLLLPQKVSKACKSQRGTRKSSSSLSSKKSPPPAKKKSNKRKR